MTAKLTISSPSQNNLEDVALIFAKAFDDFPDEIAHNLKIVTDGNAPQMGMGTKPTAFIYINLEHYSKEALAELTPLLKIIQVLIGQLSKDETDIKLKLSVDDDVTIWSSDEKG